MPFLPTSRIQAVDWLGCSSLHEIKSGGKTYKIHRGDTHRRTEFSMDGYDDGSLLQAYRYAIDAASLDYYANSEHNYLGGPDVPYHDFLLQQFADNFHVPGRFVPPFAYERSIPYPHGHRNIISAKRRVRPFRISPEEFGRLFPFSSEAVTERCKNPEPVGTTDLYEYLKRHGGIAIAHSAACSGAASRSVSRNLPARAERSAIPCRAGTRDGSRRL